MANFIKYSDMKYDKGENELFYISDENGIKNLWKFSFSDRKISQITDEPQNIKDYWLENDKIILAIDYNGNERNQFYELKNKKTVPLIRDPDHFHHYGVCDGDSGKYIFTRNHHSSAIFELCIFDGKEGTTVLEQFDSPTYIKKQMDDGNLLMTMDLDNIDKELFVYNLHGRSILKVPLQETRFRSVTVKKDGMHAYCITDWEGGILNLYDVNLHDWSYRRMTSFDWDIEHFKISCNEKSALISINENGCSKLFHYNLENHYKEKLDFRNDGVIHSMEWSGSNEIYILFSSIDTAHCIYQLDLKRGVQGIILRNKEEAETVRWRILSYVSFDGMEVPYFLYEPEDGPSSAVIHVHGGPEAQARPEFNELYYRLYRKGVSVAVPNIRGSLGYGRHYLEADDQEKRMDAVQDVVELRNHLIDRRSIDDKKISIMGRSYGGFMTLLLITHHPDLWKKAVDIVGISDLRTFLINTPEWRRNQRSEEYGFLGRNDTMFNEISPLSRARDIKAPLLIFHSHHDSRVPYTESVQMAERMKDNGQDITFTAYENEGHTFIRKENIDDMNKKIVMFLTDEK